MDLRAIGVTALCLAGTGVGLKALYDDVNRSGGVGLGSPMAQVERHAAKVRRKVGSSYVWNPVRPHEDLYRRDSVQTAKGAAATIRFKDGAQVELGENSLVVIDDLSQLSLNFVRGSVVVRSKDGASDGDQKISVDKDGKAKVEKILIRLTSPEPAFRAFTPDQQPKSVTFSWTAPQGKPGATLELAPNGDFKSKLLKRFSASSQGLTLTPPPGAYSWRVTTASQEVSEARSLRIVGVAPIKPLFPGINQKITQFGEKGSVQFRLCSNCPHA